MHVTLHGPKHYTAHGFFSTAYEPRLEKLGGRRHAAGCHKHLRYKSPTCGKVIPQLGHTGHETPVKQLSGLKALVQTLTAQFQHFLFLSAAQGLRQLGKQAASPLLSGFYGDICLWGSNAPGQRGYIYSRHVEHRIVFIDFIVDNGVHMGEHGPGQTVSDAGDKVPAGTAGF